MFTDAQIDFVAKRISQECAKLMAGGERYIHLFHVEGDLFAIYFW